MQAWEEKKLSPSGLSVEAASNYASVKLVENGAGIALVPQKAAHREWPTGVRALGLGQHTSHRDIGPVHRARQSFTEPVQILAQLISDQVKTGSE